MIQFIPAWQDGTLTPVEKIDTHRRGLRHPAVSVFVNDGDRTLLQRRALGKYHTPGLWANACCTHPVWGEPMLDCAYRRLGEELGIQKPDISLIPRGQIEYRANVGDGLTEHELVSLFTAEVQSTLKLEPNANEVMETRWISMQCLRQELVETPDNFTPWLRIYFNDHNGQIFGSGDSPN